MALFSTATITRFAQEAEDLFVKNHHCIIDRTALSIVANTHTYSLPSYLIDVRRITWKGLKIYPASHRGLRESQASLTSTSATPYNYIFDNIGQAQIRFFPIPSVTIASIGTNLYGSEIVNRVIVEFYRSADYATFTIPSFFRKRLIKAYVLKMCFSLEGRGQNLKAAKYWHDKWNYYNEIYGMLLEELVNEPRHIILGPGGISRDFNLRTLENNLSYDNIGIGVEKGE